MLKVIIAALLVLVVGHWLLYRYMRRRIDAAKRAKELEDDR